MTTRPNPFSVRHDVRPRAGATVYVSTSGMRIAKPISPTEARDLADMLVAEAAAAEAMMRTVVPLVKPTPTPGFMTVAESLALGVQR